MTDDDILFLETVLAPNDREKQLEMRKNLENYGRTEVEAEAEAEVKYTVRPLDKGGFVVKITSMESKSN